MFQLLLKYLYLLLIFMKVNSETHIIPTYKYILRWTDAADLHDAGEGRDQFLERNCPYSNCYITSNREYLNEYTDFDVILFNSPGLSKMKSRKKWPEIRDPAQKYVFMSKESADYFPVCTEIYEHFFNWTWTYKLNSDIAFPYMTIRDKHYNVIGPKLGIKWLSMEDMDDINEELKLKLKSKKKLVAWFVSNWFPRSSRTEYAEKLSKSLRDQGYKLDIYGKFGVYHCNNCLTMLEEDYYFYLSLENSLSEDYVTEKLLNPLVHYSVPIVYGGADYSRFLPNGSYLDAIKLGAQEVASIMINAMEHPQQYYKFFKWHNHYSYHYTADSPDTDVYCNFCKILNNSTLMKKPTTVNIFKKWWNPLSRCNFNKYDDQDKNFHHNFYSGIRRLVNSL